MSATPIIRHKFTADPTAIVHENKVFLFTGHDEPPPGVDDYVMHDWLCFSSSNLTSWQEYPSPLKAKDFAWAYGDAYASKVVFKDDWFYWFVAVTHQHIPGKAIGVAKALQPEGPYQDALGHALITGDMLPGKPGEKANLDPTVLIDGDGRSYICWGHQVCYFAELKNDFTGLVSDISTISLPHFMEGSHLCKRNDWYYLLYGHGTPEQIGYAMSRDVHGPWEFKGFVCGPADNSETNRPATLEYGGRMLFFFHNGKLPGGGSHRRSVCLDELYFNADGTIQEVKM